MGIEKLSFGRDYATEFKASTDAQIKENEAKMARLGMTVPIGQSQNDKSKTSMKGLEVEHTTTSQEPPKNVDYEAAATQEGAIDRQLSTKDERKAETKKATQAIINNGTANGYKIKDKDTAERYAENYVENEHNKEDVKGTQVFMDKDAYDKAEKARKAKRKELVTRYREQGMSKKEAKAKADAQLVENEYVRGRKTRRFVEDNRDMFYDKDGNFSSDKFKAKAVEYANTNTTEGEEVNYHLSLKERRKVAEKEDTKANVIKNIAKKSNVSYEKDNTNLYKGLVIAGGTGLGVASGPLFTTSAAAAAAGAGAGSAVAPGAGSSAAGSAAASTAVKSNGYGVGTAVGLGTGLALSTLVKDKGKVEPKVYAPAKGPEQKPDEVPEKPVKNTPQKPVEPVQVEPQEEPCPEEKWQSEFCDHKVQRGDDWTKVSLAKVKTINGKKPDGKMLRAFVHAEKLKHGVTDFSLNTMPKAGEIMRVYSDFSDLLADEALVKKHPELLLLKDATIELNCDGGTDGKSSAGKPKVKFTPFTGAPTNPVKYKQDCHDNAPVIVK